MDEYLTPKQHAAINALLATRTVEEAAETAGCHPASIRRWMKDGGFSAALQGSATRAAHTLEDELDSDSSGVRVRAAISILERAIKGTELYDVIERLEALEEVLERHHGN